MKTWIAVRGAYGWNDLADKLVGKPGATIPTQDKVPGQVAAEDELLSRLAALNLERTVEEKRGLVRWLRPEYQAPKAAALKPAQEEIDRPYSRFEFLPTD